MSVESRQKEVASIQKALAALQKQDAEQAKKEVARLKSIEQTKWLLEGTRSDSMTGTYNQRLVKFGEDAAKLTEQRANVAKKIAEKTSKLHAAEQALAKEREREQKKLADSEKRREKEQLAFQRKLNRELQLYKSVEANIWPPELGITMSKKHDAFISHASEDKADFVRPLAEALTAVGFDIWYDDFALSVGDSLRQSIDKGLSGSRYGIVVLSAAFFAKNWPQYELNGLVAKEMDGKR